MELPKLYRRRFIPDEMVYLKDDAILQYRDDLIITSWTTLKPRCDIARGISAYYTQEGFKISRVYNRREEPVYWYCDIIRTLREPEENRIIFEDLLLDIVLYENGFVKVLDMDELALALEHGLIRESLATLALHTANRLLGLIYDGNFSRYQLPVINLESQSAATPLPRGSGGKYLSEEYRRHASGPPKHSHNACRLYSSVFFYILCDTGLLFLLEHSDSPDMPLVIREWSVQKDLDNLSGQPRADHSSAHTQNVRIIMQSGRLCREAVMTQGGADSLHLIRRNGDPDPRSADQDSLLALTGQDLPGHLLRVLRIIARILRIRPAVPISNLLLLKKMHDLLFELKASVITA